MQWVEISPASDLLDGRMYRVIGSAPGMGAIDHGKLLEIVGNFQLAEASLMKPFGPRITFIEHKADETTGKWIVTVRYKHDTRNWAQKDMTVPASYNGGSLFGLLLGGGAEANVWLCCETLEAADATGPVTEPAEAGIVGWGAGVAVTAIVGYFAIRWLVKGK